MVASGESSSGHYIAKWRDAVLDDPTLIAGEKLVGMGIARFANSSTRSTFQAAVTLAGLVGLSERSTRTHVNALLAKCWLRAEIGPRRTRAWATRELILQMPATIAAAPERGPATVAAAADGAATIAAAPGRGPAAIAAAADGAATIAAAQGRGAAKNDARCGKKRPEVRQPLPTIPKIYPEDLIPTRANPKSPRAGSVSPARAENEKGRNRRLGEAAAAGASLEQLRELKGAQSPLMLGPVLLHSPAADASGGNALKRGMKKTHKQRRRELSKRLEVIARAVKGTKR